MGLLNIRRKLRVRDKRPIREIARRTAVSRNTIKKYLNAGTIEPLSFRPGEAFQFDWSEDLLCPNM